MYKSNMETLINQYQQSIDKRSALQKIKKLQQSKLNKQANTTTVSPSLHEPSLLAVKPDRLKIKIPAGKSFTRQPHLPNRMIMSLDLTRNQQFKLNQGSYPTHSFKQPSSRKMKLQQEDTFRCSLQAPDSTNVSNFKATANLSPFSVDSGRQNCGKLFNNLSPTALNNRTMFSPYTQKMRKLKLNNRDIDTGSLLPKIDSLLNKQTLKMISNPMSSRQHQQAQTSYGTSTVQTPAARDQTMSHRNSIMKKPTTSHVQKRATQMVVPKKSIPLDRTANIYSSNVKTRQILSPRQVKTSKPIEIMGEFTKGEKLSMIKSLDLSKIDKLS